MTRQDMRNSDVFSAQLNLHQPAFQTRSRLRLLFRPVQHAETQADLNALLQRRGGVDVGEAGFVDGGHGSDCHR
jgi:hypothetical protein